MFLNRLRERVAKTILRSLEPIVGGQDELKSAVGQLQARQLAATKVDSLRDAEFSVFSQWGEDGIIQHLIRMVPIENEEFVEFGVGDYSESNTRFLLSNNNWRGLIIDRGEHHVEFTQRRGLQWRHSLEVISSFITVHNINDVIGGAGMDGDIGLLSVDIDGNDYWVLKAIEQVHPRIVIVEYNSTFGPEHAVTIPYDPSFDRLDAHFSGLYWGASLGAFYRLLSERGLQFVGSNSAGNNAFFVRRDLAHDLPDLTPSEGYVASRYRDSRDQAGRLSYVTDHRDRLRLIASKVVVDLPSDREVTIGERFGVT